MLSSLPFMAVAETKSSKEFDVQSFMFENFAILAAILVVVAVALAASVAAISIAAVRNRNSNNAQKIKPGIGKGALGILVIACMFLPMGVNAQDAAAVEAAPQQTVAAYSAEVLVHLVYGLVVLIALLSVLLLFAIDNYLKVVHSSSLSRLLSLPNLGFNRVIGMKGAGKPGEVDAELGHEYDGIIELDNAAPPLFVYILYGTIIYAVVHLTVFHVLEIGVLQDEEYSIQMAEGERQRSEYMKLAANRIDENSVVLQTDQADVDEGKDVYMNNCAACHGKVGEGAVGPNLTDAYWLHGGGIKNVFKTVKYGVPEKGMISWEKQLSPIQMARVSSYILSLAGTNPPNPKAPQGEVWQGDSTSPVDSVKTDSTETRKTEGAMKGDDSTTVDTKGI